MIDDIRPFEELTPEVWGKDAHLFTIRPATGRPRLPGWVDSYGTAVYRGENPPEGALISWYLRRVPGDSVKVAVTNADGQPVANFTRLGVAGINRLSWDLRPTKDLLTSQYGGQAGDRFVVSGEYTVTLTVGAHKESQKLQVTIPPGVDTRRGRVPAR